MAPERAAGGTSRLAWVYGGIALAGLGTVSYCVARLWGSDDPAWGKAFLDALFANWAATVILVDLLIAAAAAIVWVVAESRRLGMRWAGWLVLLLTTPIAFSFPLFLAFRERRRGSAAPAARHS